MVEPVTLPPCRDYLKVERNRDIAMLNAGMTETEVDRKFGCNRCSFTRLVRRYRQTGVTGDQPRSGQPRVNTPAQDPSHTLA